MNQKLLAMYGLKWNPFGPEVPTEALYVPPKVENFCWCIEQAHLREDGFALIYGDPGSGKPYVLWRRRRWLPGDLDSLIIVLRQLIVLARTAAIDCARQATRRGCISTLLRRPALSPRIMRISDPAPAIREIAQWLKALSGAEQSAC